MPLYKKRLNSLTISGKYARQVKATSKFCKKNGCALFHVENKRGWTIGDLFSKCEHPKLTKKQIKSKEEQLPNSDAFMVLQDIATSKTILNDFKH